ncbi:hypothetical protein [Microcoleus sp. Pol12B5]|uniref:hypothetical protein n=1 Tax=Microcoleus sp. Pol12B5 TaxID=3055396 RepID=UPI002FD65A3B
MLIPENIQIFQRSQKSIGYTHTWSEAGDKYQCQLEANLLLRADRGLRSLFGVVSGQTIRAIISHIIWYAIA